MIRCEEDRLNPNLILSMMNGYDYSYVKQTSMH